MSHTPRYLVTRVPVPARYRRSGWHAFDTLHLEHGPIWPDPAEAQADADRLNRSAPTCHTCGQPVVPGLIRCGHCRPEPDTSITYAGSERHPAGCRCADCHEVSQ